ncbi:uncharacterized protein LOC119015448 isoform X2 [Acanthopagrus latus]|uniref:uncharacterized protein LOC119015448 isoform X2 n=1 Tax=Acanthopagrus latus TaxID=8177 RepID=UPI00187CA55E|nr:uncharacterized protein LOC119015448 isoform X2 [Acanthopagrus latus]
MDLLWIILPVLLGHVHAENVIEVKVLLGQSRTLNCSINDTQKIYWYLEIRSRFRALIVETMRDDPSDNMYYVHPSKTKYEAIEGRRLVIRNITAEDCRLYSCARRNSDNVIFIDTFSIVSDVSNQSEANYQAPVSSIWQSDLITCSSLGLNLVLLLVVTGLVSKSLCSKSQNCNNQLKESDGFNCENLETVETPQYEEIQLDRAGPPAAPPSECIYYKAQLPQATLPRH